MCPGVRTSAWGVTYNLRVSELELPEGRTDPSIVYSSLRGTCSPTMVRPVPWCDRPPRKSPSLLLSEDLSSGDGVQEQPQ